MLDTAQNNGSLLYRILVSPSFRPVRHIVVVLALAAISLSQNAHGFLANSDAIGNGIYLVSLATLIAYLAVVYFHIYVLVPRLLLKKRYLSYLVISSVVVWLLVCLKPLQEYLVNEHLGLPHARSNYMNSVAFFDTLSDFVLNMLAITGGSVTIMLKKWMEEKRHINELEKQHLQSEIDAMKEQVNPQLLFHTLNRIGNLASTDPDKAADMVIKLSQLLRYELYDGSRESVLLTSEIAFLKDYLILEQFYDNSFDYEVCIQGDISRVFIPPLIFIPIVQEAVKMLPRESGDSYISLDVSVKTGVTEFVCIFSSGRLAAGFDFGRLMQRLTLFYRQRFSLTSQYDSAKRHTSVCLLLNQG